MVEPHTRVCPRCGTPVGENHFCGTCGLHLTGQREPPTRAELEQRPSQLSRPTAAGASGVAPSPSTGGLVARFRRLRLPQRAAVVGGLVALLVVPVAIVVSSGNDEQARTAVAVQDPGPTAAEACVARWNSGASENARSLIGGIARNFQADEVVPTYVSAGYSADIPDRCLITVAQPDLGTNGIAYQFRETAQGTFEYPSGHISSLTALPDSVKQWNAQGDRKGTLTLGAP